MGDTCAARNSVGVPATGRPAQVTNSSPTHYSDAALSSVPGCERLLCRGALRFAVEASREAISVRALFMPVALRRVRRMRTTAFGSMSRRLRPEPRQSLNPSRIYRTFTPALKKR